MLVSPNRDITLDEFVSFLHNEGFPPTLTVERIIQASGVSGEVDGTFTLRAGQKYGIFTDLPQ